MDNSRLIGRNAAIASMFADEKQLKNYYRFTALNPHLNLYDACNILLQRPDATVCFPYEEWNDLGRQVIRGKKSVTYYDYDGYKQYVFDVSDTRGENYQNSTIPIEKVIVGFEELNGTDISEENDSDYVKILKATKLYMHIQGIETHDNTRFDFLSEGIAYSLYVKTGLEQNEAISIQCLPFDFKDNAELVKEVYIQAESLAQEIEDTYRNKEEEVAIIDDTEEETVSDEPIVSVEQVEQPKVAPYYSEIHRSAEA